MALCRHLNDKNSAMHSDHVLHALRDSSRMGCGGFSGPAAQLCCTQLNSSASQRLSPLTATAGCWGS